jgi:signal transduction histidine kinase/DNA-binding response OmpR family regulator
MESAVRAELVALVYRQTPFTLVMAVVFSAFLWALLKPFTEAWLIDGWFIVNNLITLGRYLLIRAYRAARPAPEDAEIWSRRFALTTLAAGIVWGMLGTVLYPPPGNPYQSAIISAIIGLAAVGLFTLSPILRIYLALAVPILLPSGVYLAFSNVPVEQVGGAFLCLFLFIAVTNARRNQKNMAETLRLRFRLALAAQAAEAASRAKSRFLANMSHEIRTPLNGVLGMAQLLLERVTDQRDREDLQTLYLSGQQLLAIINDVLDISKIEAGRAELANGDFDLRRILGEVTTSLGEQARRKGLQLLLDIDEDVPRFVRGDAVRLKQVLINLMGNAIKFTANGSVRTHVARGAAAGEVRFAVRDTGIGIAPKDHERIFDSFSQADSSPGRRYGGTGLGLAISRQLVELMGGKLDVESALGRGSTFRFSALFAAPADETRAAESAFPARQPLPGLSGHVLLVEDIPINRAVSRGMLESLGLTVSVAEDGEEAVAKAAQQSFDAILMDCHMPGMDGYEATQRIRAAEKAAADGRHVPIVAVTANAIVGDRELCLVAGMDTYLGKPFLRKDLHAILAHWLPPQDDAVPRSAPEAPIADSQLRRMFLVDGQRLVDDLNAALATGDHALAVRTAHSLRSVSSHVEAGELATACATLESNLRSGNVEEVNTALSGVRQHFAETEASFEASLPAPPSASMVAESVAAYQAVAPDSPCALVVDDEPNDRFLIGRVLTRLGFRVEECDCGNDALSICRDHRPDLVVLDGILPGMDGVATCVALRAEKNLSELPIIMVSGIQDESWRTRARDAGATAVVDKAVAARKLADDLGLTIAAITQRARRAPRASGMGAQPG